MSKPKKFSEFSEGYGDAKYSPNKLGKELPKGYSYGDERQGKGDHKKRTLQVDDKGKKVDTDIEVGGAHGGREKYSPSWGDGHRKAKKTLDGIDKEVSEIKGQKKSDTAKRMSRSYARLTKTAGEKVLSDVTGRGRKTNPQGHGNKAARRALGEAADHPEAAAKEAINQAREGGMGTGEAHEATHGEADLRDPQAMGKLAGSFARVQKDHGSNAPVPDKGSKSLYAQEKAKSDGAEQGE